VASLKKLSDINHLKINMDEGQGTLKLLLQIIFKDCPTLQPDFSRKDFLKLQSQDLCRYLDSGVMRTYVLAEVPGAAETHSEVRQVMDRVNWADLLEQLERYGEAKLRACNDGKMRNQFLGIGPHSSSFPSSYSLFSQYTDRSQPSVPRSIGTVEADLKKLKEGGSSVECHNVETDPVELLKLLRDKRLADVMPPEPLHSTTLGTNKLLYYLSVLVPAVAVRWAQASRVNPNPRRGNNPVGGVAGNDCRKLLKNIPALKKMLPTLPSLRRKPSFDSPAYAIQTAWALVPCFETFVPSSTQSPPLSSTRSSEVPSRAFPLVGSGFLSCIATSTHPKKA